MSERKIIPFVQNVFVPLVSVGTAAMVGWLNYSISQVDQDLKARITAVDIAVKEGQEERAKLDSEREFNFKIYDLVQKSIEENNEKKQEVAKAFIIVMVDGDLRKHLLGVLENAGTPRVQAETAKVIAQEEIFESDQSEIHSQQRAVRASFDWEDWDYDLFWCTSSGSAAEEQAALVKEALAREGAKGRLRVRELPDSVNAKPGYKVSGYSIRRSNNEVAQADALEALAERVLRASGYAIDFRAEPTSTRTAWYVSAFFCP